jgi:hypothetical protein
LDGEKGGRKKKGAGLVAASHLTATTSYHRTIQLAPLASALHHCCNKTSIVNVSKVLTVSGKSE